MKRYYFTLFAALFAFGCHLSAQVYQQNNQNVIQQNQQNVNINVPVIEKKVYIDRYRTVYVDRPQPKRVARKLSTPICLHGYLWVYTEDIGNFKKQSDALEIIRQINVQAPFDRDTWRIPTSAELTVMEQNADLLGLGEDIYLATDHRNGVLRMVSTGPTATERRVQEHKRKQAYSQWLEEQQKQEEARLALKRQEQEEQARIKEKEQKQEEQIRQRILAKEYNQKKAEEEVQRQMLEEEKIADASEWVTINGVTWATRNLAWDGSFVKRVHLGGHGYFTHKEAESACPRGWRLPTESEMRQLYAQPKREEIINNVKGTRFGRGRNSIFLPVVGRYGYDGKFSSSGGTYWSGTVSSKDIYYMDISIGYSGGVKKSEFSGKNKKIKYPVRCVRKQ